MAATVSAWAKPGGWALDSEQNEMELLQQRQDDAAAGGGHSEAGEAADFPSLSAAAKTKKKKKAQTLSLLEFSSYGAEKPSPTLSKGFTPDELLVLPTGPRQRSAEELDRNRLGGGFRSYGGGMRDEQPRRQGSFNRESNREFAPSRADEIDNWASGKKSPINNGIDRRDRGGRGGFFTDSQSRADEVDNWVSNKSFNPSEPRRFEKRGGFGLDSGNGGADSGNWAKRKEEEGRKTGGAFDSLRERRGGFFESSGADSESWERKREEGSAGGRPRLNLQPRTLPLNEEQKSEIASVVKPKGSSPFGDARPREEVLKEKGQDWKEIEEKLESTKIQEFASDGPAVAKKSLWSGNGRDQPRLEDKTERAWRKPEVIDNRSESANESENGPSENAEDRHRDEAEQTDTQM